MPPKPKKKCCVTKPRCKRCPLRLMAEGRLPDGYTVRKRKLVRSNELLLAATATLTGEKAAQLTEKSEKKGGKKGGKKSKKSGKKAKKLVTAA